MVFISLARPEVGWKQQESKAPWIPSVSKHRLFPTIPVSKMETVPIKPERVDSFHGFKRKTKTLPLSGFFSGKRSQHWSLSKETILLCLPWRLGKAVGVLGTTPHLGDFRGLWVEAKKTVNLLWPRIMFLCSQQKPPPPPPPPREEIQVKGCTQVTEAPMQLPLGWPAVSKAGFATQWSIYS